MNREAEQFASETASSGGYVVKVILNMPPALPPPPPPPLHFPSLAVIAVLGTASSVAVRYNSSREYEADYSPKCAAHLRLRTLGVAPRYPCVRAVVLDVYTHAC